MSVKHILISQQAPAAMSSSPYPALAEKYGVEIEFHPFFLIEPVASKEFRAQRINILDYTAIVFSAKAAIDAFFFLCDDLRVKVPETMKYFCTNESVALYLQKHIVYRKRKIFFGNGTAASVISEIGSKHKGEKFLVATSGSTNNDITRAFEAAKLDFTPAMMVKPVSQDIKSLDLPKYDLIVLFNGSDVKSLYENFPEYKQSNKFVAFGKSAEKGMNEAGLKIEIVAPTPEIPSVAKAIESFIEKQ